jgi:LPS sulfotransferase NodH
MMHYGIGVPREYFNPTRIREFAALYKIAGLADGGRLAADKAARQQYIIELFKHRVANGIFASKIQWGQYASFLENAEGDALLSQGHFIHLFREDLLAQAISRHIAVETGRWGVDGRVTSRPSPKPRFFDVDLIEGYLKLLAQANMNWRLFFCAQWHITSHVDLRKPHWRSNRGLEHHYRCLQAPVAADPPRLCR